MLLIIVGFLAFVIIAAGSDSSTVNVGRFADSQARIAEARERTERAEIRAAQTDKFLIAGTVVLVIGIMVGTGYLVSLQRALRRQEEFERHMMLLQMRQQRPMLPEPPPGFEVFDASRQLTRKG